MAYDLGVDLGTTFTAAAVVEDGGPPHLLGLGNRAMQIPSVLYVQTDGSVVVGEAAERRGAADPTRIVRESKRRIGDPVPIVVGGTPFAPQALAAKLLRWVVARATQRMGGPPSHVVVTHPANWGPYKLDLMLQVVGLADLDSVSMLSEPEAAATQYASTTRVPTGAQIAVYDLGGGTFDACVLAKTDDGFEVRGRPEGIEHLGGIDFDEAVFDHVLQSLGGIDHLDLDDPDVVVSLARLRRDCVEAKEALSDEVDATVAVAVPGLRGPARITRGELEALVRPSLFDTHTALARALSSAGVEGTDLAALVLVGGSSRMPMVGQLLEQELGLTTAIDAHPKHSIALGAVLRARFAESVPTVAGRVEEVGHQPATPPPPPAPTSDVGPSESAEPTQVIPASDLNAGRLGAQNVQPPPPPQRSQPQVAGAARSGRRRAWLVVVAAVAAAALVAGVIVVALWRGDPPAVDPRPEPSAPPQGPALTTEQMIVRAGDQDRLDIVDLDGTDAPRTLVEGDVKEPFLSPDRRTVGYVRDDEGGGELWVVGTDGSSPRALFDEPICTNPGRGSWFPSGREDERPLILLACDEGFLKVTLEGKLLAKILPDVDIHSASIDPSGTKVAVARQGPERNGGRLDIVDLNTGISTPVPTGVGALHGGPVWSADGELLAFRRKTPESDPGTGANGIWVATTGSSPTARALVDDPAVAEYAPSWAPTGRRLAFTTSPTDDSAPVQVAVIDLTDEDAAPEIVSPSGEFQALPEWGRH